VLERHRWHGIPEYVRGHHPAAMTLEIATLRAKGYLTTKDVAAELGIGVTTLLRLEGEAYRPVPRLGKRRMRVFTRRQVEQLRGGFVRPHRAQDRGCRVARSHPLLPICAFLEPGREARTNDSEFFVCPTSAHQDGRRE
jgi:DNA-binding XRE family transcriptional regulator